MALLGLRFLAEMGMLACLGVGGWQRGDSLLESVALGVGLPAVAAGVWGRWVAPRAPQRLPDPARLSVEVVLFTVALLVVWGAEPSPAMSIAAVAVWASFLVSIPARGHEPAPAQGTDSKAVT